MDLLTKVAASAGAAHPGWCEECALPRLLKLALHRDYNIRVVRWAGAGWAGWAAAVQRADGRQDGSAWRTR